MEDSSGSIGHSFSLFLSISLGVGTMLTRYMIKSAAWSIPLWSQLGSYVMSCDPSLKWSNFEWQLRGPHIRVALYSVSHFSSIVIARWSGAEWTSYLLCPLPSPLYRGLMDGRPRDVALDQRRKSRKTKMEIILQR